MKRIPDRTVVALVLIVGGAALAVVSALGDQLGGAGGFGWKQILGVAVGGAAVLLGLVIVGVRLPRTR